jgi:sigma-B regulation protein RsbU (phosphoserine phosphatase)
MKSDVEISPPGRLLVVDDNEMNRDMLSRRLGKRGYNVVCADGGRQAIQMLLGPNPVEPFDVVLLDVMMPEIDGLTVLRRVREQFGAEALPVIMATAKDDAGDVVEALRLGANDYVTKPLQFSVVAARVATHLAVKRNVDRVKELEKDVHRKNTELLAANEKMRRDLVLAASVQHAMLPVNVPTCSTVRFAWKYRPCEELAGDILGIFALDEHHIGLYLLDVSGHGVHASLLSCTLSKMLAPGAHGWSLVHEIEPGTGKLLPAAPSEVVKELNVRFPMESIAEQYFTLFYGVLDSRSGLLRYVTAAHPPLIHHSNAGEARVIESAGFAVGWFADAEWEEQSLQLSPGDRIYLCSDGVSEAMGPNRELYGSGRLAASAASVRDLPLDKSLDRLVNAAAAWTPRFTDDVSALAVEFLSADASAECEPVEYQPVECESAVWMMGADEVRV